MGWLILFYTLEVFKWLIVARALLSWFVGPHSRHPAAEILRRITDPVIQPISRAMPAIANIDLSPLVAFFALTILQQVVLRIS